MLITVRSKTSDDNIDDPELVEAFVQKIADLLSDPYLMDGDVTFLEGVRAWVLEKKVYSPKQHWSVLKVVDRVEERYLKHQRSDDSQDLFNDIFPDT